MPHYKDTNNNLHYIEREFAHLLPAGSVEISDAEADAIRNPPLTQEQLLQQFIAAMEYHYDLVAKRKQYDNRLTCALRAGYPGPFQAEGQAFAVWMDNCNLYGYEQMDRVLNGQRPMPTVSGLIAELPAAPW